MSNSITTINEQAAQINPFARQAMPQHANAGAVAIEQERAVAEAQGKLVIAKRFPRDEARAFQKAMDACARPSLATVANYSFPRAGQTVAGPSIRLAEELARCWGNIDYGIRELSRKDGVSEMEAYAWDMETNVISSQKFTVRHVRDTRGGGKELTEERDIYELTANMGGRRLRSRILAILPPDLVDAAVQQCRSTLAGNSQEPLADRVRKMVAAFGKLGVPAANIETRLGHTLDQTTADELADMIGIYQSIRDGMTKAADWFNVSQPTAKANDSATVSAINAAAKTVNPVTQRGKKEATPTEPEPTNAPEPMVSPDIETEQQQMDDVF